jgi:hypothetical protein
MTPLELTSYAGGIAATVIGYYFNHQFVADYAVFGGNPIWGPGSWQQFIVLGYDNPAASSAFALAFYFAVAERQHRHERAAKTLDPLRSGA